MSRFFSFRFTRQVLVLIGLICLAALIWYVGPLVAIGEFKPLEGRRTRLLMIALVFACWLCKLAVRFWRDRNMNQRLLSQLAARQPEKPQAGQADEQTAELERRFDHALSILKNSRLNTGKPHWYSRLSRQYVYQLPWYVFIGAPGSGKTTALVNSGLTFPLADQFGRAAIRGVGGTRHCDWWFTNEAVMLDTAGRYTTQESNEQSDKAEWEGFLRLLRKFRPRQPINGVLLTVSVDDLIKMSADERHQQSVSFRKRLNELRESLRIRFPVYVLVTKLDLLAGFAEYFAGMGRAERSQVWGFTAPYGDNARAPDFKSWYRPEFELLLARIHRGMPRRLQDEIDLNARADVFDAAADGRPGGCARRPA
jgi:type VI secretion system protein ImpL